MKKVYVTLPSVPHEKYFTSYQLPGYLIINQIAPSNHLQHVIQLPELSEKVVQMLVGLQKKRTV